MMFSIGGKGVWVAGFGLSLAAGRVGRALYLEAGRTSLMVEGCSYVPQKGDRLFSREEPREGEEGFYFWRLHVHKSSGRASRSIMDLSDYLATRPEQPAA